MCKVGVNKDGSDIRNYRCVECARIHANEYNKKNRGKVNAKKREWKKNNPEKQRQYDLKARQNLKRDAISAYSGGGYKCACCGESEMDFLCLDHINDNGSECRKKHGGGNTFFGWLRRNKYPDIGLQVLCYNCNNGKKIRGKCVHNRRKLEALAGSWKDVDTEKMKRDIKEAR